MTIEEIKKEKEILEQEIEKLINDFEFKTKTEVTEICFSTEKWEECLNNKKINFVTIEVKII